jgi:pilus assembly protein FimV
LHKTLAEEIKPETPAVTEADEDPGLEFTIEPPKTTGKKTKKEAEVIEETLEAAIPEPVVEETKPLETTAEDTPLANPLKSKKALDTLLALAKTYIGMGDIDSARQSLEEVLEHGDETQKEAAQQLLNDLPQ